MKRLLWLALLAACNSSDGSSDNDTFDLPDAGPGLPPDTALEVTPPSPSADAVSHFELASATAGVTFRCRVDGGASTPCTSPLELELAEGEHTVEVRAVDAAGLEDATPAVYSWIIDRTPPHTVVDQAPSGSVASADASLAFSASEPATFRCTINGAAAISCASPLALVGLAPGPQQVIIQAIDLAGNTDPAGVAVAWTVDLSGPVTNLTGTPGDGVLTKSASVSFIFTAAEALRFECSQDDAAFATCTSPVAYTAADGDHTFAVRGFDVAGNEGPTVRRRFKVDTVAPSTSITAGPAQNAFVPALTARFEFSASEMGSTFRCSTGGAYVDCTSPYDAVAPSDGVQTFRVIASDAAFNFGEPVERVWTADTLAPTAALGGGPTEGSYIQGTAVRFTFTASEEATFTCSINGGTFSPCTSPYAYDAVFEMQHSFRVIATDRARTPSAPVERKWTRDITPPTLTWVTDFTQCNASTNYSFRFRYNEPLGATNPDVAASGTDSGGTPHIWAGQTSTWVLPQLGSPGYYRLSSYVIPEGSYSVFVHAVDRAGNVRDTTRTFVNQCPIP